MNYITSTNIEDLEFYYKMFAERIMLYKQYPLTPMSEEQFKNFQEALKLETLKMFDIKKYYEETLEL